MSYSRHYHYASLRAVARALHARLGAVRARARRRCLARGFVALLLLLCSTAQAAEVYLVVAGHIAEPDEQAARDLVLTRLSALLREDSQLRIASYGRDRALDDALQSAEQWREALALARAGWTAEAGQVALGEALAKLADQTEAAGTGPTQVLVVGGIASAPAGLEKIAPTLVSRLQALKIQVHTVALAAANAGALVDLARATGGGHVLAPRANAAANAPLDRFLLQLALRAGLISALPLIDQSFLVDANVEELTIVVTKPGGAENKVGDAGIGTETGAAPATVDGGDYVIWNGRPGPPAWWDNVRLRSPADQLLDKRSVQQVGDWRSTGAAEWFSVRQPVAGHWQVEGELPAASQVLVYTDLRLLADELPASAQPHVGGIVVMRLTNRGQPLTALITKLLTARAKLLGPDGQSIPLAVTHADDGSWHVELPPLTLAGLYELQATVIGQTFARELVQIVDVADPISVVVRPTAQFASQSEVPVLNADGPTPALTVRVHVNDPTLVSESMVLTARLASAPSTVRWQLPHQEAGHFDLNVATNAASAIAAGDELLLTLEATVAEGDAFAMELPIGELVRLAMSSAGVVTEGFELSGSVVERDPMRLGPVEVAVPEPTAAPAEFPLVAKPKPKLMEAGAVLGLAIAVHLLLIAAAWSWWRSRRAVAAEANPASQVADAEANAATPDLSALLATVTERVAALTSLPDVTEPTTAADDAAAVEDEGAATVPGDLAAEEVQADAAGDLAVATAAEPATEVPMATKPGAVAPAAASAPTGDDAVAADEPLAADEADVAAVVTDAAPDPEADPTTDLPTAPTNDPAGAPTLDAAAATDEIAPATALDVAENDAPEQAADASEASAEVGELEHLLDDGAIEEAFGAAGPPADPDATTSTDDGAGPDPSIAATTDNAEGAPDEAGNADELGALAHLLDDAEAAADDAATAEAGIAPELTSDEASQDEADEGAKAGAFEHLLDANEAAAAESAPTASADASAQQDMAAGEPAELAEVADSPTATVLPDSDPDSPDSDPRPDPVGEPAIDVGDVDEDSGELDLDLLLSQAEASAEQRAAPDA